MNGYMADEFMKRHERQKSFVLSKLTYLSFDFHISLLSSLLSYVYKRFLNVVPVNSFQCSWVDLNFQDNLVFLSAGIKGCSGSATSGQFMIYDMGTKRGEGEDE